MRRIAPVNGVVEEILISVGDVINPDEVAKASSVKLRLFSEKIPLSKELISFCKKARQGSP